MERGMGWYGPLIDLSAATFHVGEYVQLIVFLHRFVQYKVGRGRGREVVRTDMQVGDETRPMFSVSIWNGSHDSSLSAGDILFLRNVKLMSFRSVVEARTVHYSSIIRLIHPYSSSVSRGIDDLLASCRVRLVGMAKDKLRRVVQWVHTTRSSLFNQIQIPASRNWKVHEEPRPHECVLLSEVGNLSCLSKAIFFASIGEVFLHSLWPDSKNERLFISRRLASKTDIIVEDMICLGCMLCDLPLTLNSNGVALNGPLHCEKSSNRLHAMGLIYRPFTLYVWDNLNYIPLLVTNKAAELLFGNIVAEDVYKSYKCQKDEQHLKNPIKVHDYEKSEGKGVGSSSSVRALGLELKKNANARSPNIYTIWLIVLKMLLRQGKNSSLKFEILVSPGLEIGDGRFKMISVSMS